MSVLPAITLILFSIYRSLVYPIFPTFRAIFSQRQYFLLKRCNIKVNLPSEYNSANIILLFRNIIVYIMLCENAGQPVHNSDFGNYGLIRKLIEIRARNVIKNRFFIYLVKHIIHVCITTNIAAHNVHTMGVVCHCTNFSELQKVTVTCTTPTKHFTVIYCFW